MRDGSLHGQTSPRRAKGLKAAALAITTCWGMGVAGLQAQQPAYPVQQQDPQVQQVAAAGEQARFDELQNEIRQLQAQLAGIQSAAAQAPPVQALPTGYLENADAGPQANPTPGAKETPILTAPSNIKLGAKMFIDNVNLSQTPGNLAAVRSVVGATTPAELDYTGLTYLRLYAQGDVFENVDFKFEIDLANSSLVPTTSPVNVLNPTAPAGFTGKSFIDTVALKDVFTTIKLLPYIGNVRVGHFKEPFMLDELISDEFQTFERRSLDDSFAPARKWGIMAFNYINENKDASAFVGCFRDDSSDSNYIERENNGDYDVCSRLVWLPYYDEPSNGRYLIHTGIDYRYSGAPNSQTNPEANPNFKTFTVTPEALTANPFLTTGNIVCNDYQEINPELAGMWGPLSVQAEATWVSFFGNGSGGASAAGDRTIFGTYVQAAYILTGENRSYDRSSKTFTSVVPYEPFFRVNTCDGVCWGKGAWEIAARYSMDDLNQSGVGQGQIRDYTVGLNWYLNQYCRFWFDYVHSDVDGKPAGGVVPAGDANIFETRFSMAY